MAMQAASRGFASDPLWQQAQACLVRGQVGAARQVLASMQARQPAGDVYAYLLAAQIAWREDRVRDGTRHALARGNALMHARLHDEAARHHAWLDRFLSVWSTVDRQPVRDHSGGPLPIFIIGMARSGTTLLERMLGNHSQVAVAGELMDFGAQLHWMADTRNAQSDTLVSRLPRLDYAELGRRYLAQTQWRA